MNKFHRLLSLVLCLALVLFCLSVPFRSSAAADAGFVSISLGGTFVSVSGAVAVAVLVLSGLGIVWGSIEEAVAEAKLWYNAVPKIVKDWLDKAGQQVVEGHTTVKIPETVIEGINSVDEAHQLSPSSPYLDTSGFNLDTISPTDLFAQDVVGAIQQSGSTTHSLLRTLYGLLNTGFADLVQTFTSEIGTLETTLSGSLSDVELSTDLIRRTLSEDLSDLKTVYSSFGNSTLDKLDTLNDSIQALDFSSVSGDFVDLYNLIDENDALIINALQDLPELFSDSFSSYFENLSDLLSNINTKLGDESSYLSFLVYDISLIRNNVDDGLVRVLEALESLDVDVSDVDLSVDLQPVIDQIFESEMTLAGGLNDLYKIVNESFQSVSSTLTSQLGLSEDIKTLVTYSLNELISLQDSLEALNVTASVDMQPVIDRLIFFEASTVSELRDLYSILELSFGSIQSSLDELSGTIVSNFDITLDAFAIRLSDEFSSLKTSVINMKLALQDDIQSLSSEVASLKSNLVDELQDIKTLLQSIAGTTTTDPSPGGNNSQDDYEKEKAPLMPWVGSGFEIGGSYFNSIQGFLGDDMDAFLVAGMIFEEFAGMTFFYKLIIISCSVGLIGTLLGMALQLQGYSVAQRRREEAAQARAHNRMERSYAA